MSYLERKLTAGEQLIYTAKLHWIIFVRPMVTFSLLVFIIVQIEKHQLYRYASFLVPYKQYIYLGIMVIMVALPLLKLVIIKWTTNIGITDQRLLCKRGFIAIDLNGMPLSKIENIDSRQSIIGRILDYGVITIKGSGSTPIRIRDIANPMQFRNELAALLSN